MKAVLEQLHSISIESWLADVRAYIREHAPDILPTLDVYASEARFGRQYIAEDLNQLQPGATILEVGAGSMLLSCQLAREGYRVTALEPTGIGFSHFNRLRVIVFRRAEALGCWPHMINQSVEKFSDPDCFDYAFSINVMEHVEDVMLSIENIGTSLKLGARYRFTCPNYIFPYEPHFNIPTLFSKQLTERVLGNKISRCANIPDPVGTWKSLNWIDVIQIRQGMTRLPGLRATFSRSFLVSSLERVAYDREFAMRRSKWMCAVILALVRLRLHYLVVVFPAILQPIIDCVVTRTELKSVS